MVAGMKTTSMSPYPLTGVSAAILLGAAAALAQEQAAEPSPPPTETPAAETPPAEADKSVEERLTELEGKVEGINEPFLETHAAVAAMKKLKFSGYLHPRYEWHEDSDFGVKPDNNAPRNLNRFFVRRARLKATYVGDFSEYLLQVDMAGSTTDGMLRDAEASLVLNNENLPSGGNWEAKLTLGQFKVPFGFEVLQSSGERELPERSAVVRRFFPGERDRGIRLQGSWERFSLKAALVNGNFTNDPIYRAFDQTSWKDLAGRLGADFDFLVVGISGYWGHTLRTTLGKAASGTAPAVPTSYERYRRQLIGGDLQFYWDIPFVGGLGIKSEVVLGKDADLGFSGVAAEACRDLSTLGWYVTVVQNIGQRFGVVARLDQLDLDRDVPATCGVPALDPLKLKAAAGIDRVTTLDVGLLTHFNGNLRLALVYEHIAEQGTAKKDNDAFIAQLQAKF